MPAKFTSMKVGNYTFEFDFDSSELRISWAGSQTFLNQDETEALGDFLFEVLTVQGHPPRIQPLTITSVEVKTGSEEPSIANINTSAGDTDIDDWLERQDELTDGDGSGLHQCSWCYDQVTEGHEEFCKLNPGRNRRIVP